jgi:hypothetical protein
VPASSVKQPGTLECEVGMMRLNVHGGLHEPVFRGGFGLEPEDLSPPTTHGERGEGKNVTLDKSWYLSWQPAAISRTPTITESTLLTHILLIGGHYGDFGKQCH